MSNPDLLNQADSILRPVLRKLTRIPWMRVTGCCAGHQPEDSVWFELQVRGTSGLSSMVEWLRVLDSKLTGTDCRTDCLVNYGKAPEGSDVPHGWFPLSVEIFSPSKDDWRRSQTLIVEAVMSSVEELGDSLEAGYKSEGAVNYCPFCSSSFIRLESFDPNGHRYICGDCETAWTMIDPKL